MAGTARGRRDAERNPIEDLIVSLLSVGGFPLERTWRLLPNLAREELTNPEVVTQLDAEEIVKRLVRAGYNRGAAVTRMMALRLIHVHIAVQQRKLVQACQKLANGNTDAAEHLLCSISGVGPVVFNNFVLLREP